MTVNHFLLIMSGISTSYVSALHVEGILNGAVASPTEFPHHAAIFVRETNHSENQLLCNGVIIAPSWILSIARCFMYSVDEIKSFIFTAVAGVVDISNESVAFELLVYVYVYHDSSNHFHDIIMAKTAKNFTLSPKLKEIRTANPHETFSQRDGVVSGFGTSRVTFENDHRGPYIFVHDSDLKLRSIFVKVNYSNDCFNDFPYISTRKKFCVESQPINENKTGSCWRDDGSPVVVDDVVVGLLTNTHSDCDDTGSGSLYYEVADYHDFIYGVIYDNRSDYFINQRIGYVLNTSF